jgi:hypothetical protein
VRNLEEHLSVGAQVGYAARVADCEQVVNTNRVNKEVALPARSAVYTEFVFFKYSVKHTTTPHRSSTKR